MHGRMSMFVGQPSAASMDVASELQKSGICLALADGGDSQNPGTRSKFPRQTDPAKMLRTPMLPLQRQKGEPQLSGTVFGLDSAIGAVRTIH